MGGRQPPRHGLGGFPSGVPNPALTGTGGGSLPAEGEQVGLVKLQEEFLASIPRPEIQQVARHDTVRYPAELTEGGSGLFTEISSLEVPQRMALILTDVIFHVTCPGPYLVSPEQFLNPAAVAGYLRFELKFSGSSPVQMDGQFFSSALGLPAGGTASRAERGGWPYVDRKFGAIRTSGWAVYARSGQIVQAICNIDNPPEFVVTSIGVELAGFTLPMKTFTDLFQGA